MGNDLTVVAEIAPASEMFYLELRGDGMAPAIPSRSVLLIDTGCREPTPGAIFALLDLDGEGLVARAALVDGEICFVNDNPKYISRFRLADVQVVGRAVSHGRRI